MLLPPGSNPDSLYYFLSLVDTVYSHQDQLTTEFINYLVAKDITPGSKVKKYKLLWHIHQSYGNPKIRIRIEKKRSFYNPLTNTIRISDSSFYSASLLKYFGELAHAKQFHANPKDFYIRLFESYLRTVGRIYQAAMDYVYQVYYKEHEVPGSLEHQAHEVIREELQKEYDGAASLPK